MDCSSTGSTNLRAKAIFLDSRPARFIMHPISQRISPARLGGMPDDRSSPVKDVTIKASIADASLWTGPGRDRTGPNFSLKKGCVIDMSAPGSIGWVDLTVPDASSLRDFYSAVVGWIPGEVSMGGYSDYTMQPSGDQNPVAGICQARGANAGLPSQWLVYIIVENLDQSIQRCRDLGGSIVASPRTVGSHGRFAVIKDPAGAVAALFEPSPGKQSNQ